MTEPRDFKADDKVWHPSTKLVGIVMNIDGENASVEVPDPLTDQSTIFVWRTSTIELLDEEEFALVRDLTAAKRLKTELNKKVDEAKKVYGRAEQAMIQFLMRMAAQGTRFYAGAGQVTIDGKNVHASISEENKEIAFKEIEAMGRGEIIKRTIHPSTLESFVVELQDTGIPVPKHISVFETPKLSFAKRKST